MEAFNFSNQCSATSTTQDPHTSYYAFGYPNEHQGMMYYGQSQSCPSYADQLSPMSTMTSSSCASPSLEQNGCANINYAESSPISSNEFNFDLEEEQLLDFIAEEVEKDQARKTSTKKGGQKSVQKPLTESVRRKRRLDANARERKRMTGLNEAFSRLRTVLGCSRDRPLSKMEALQMAQHRIAELQNILMMP